MKDQNKNMAEKYQTNFGQDQFDIKSSNLETFKNLPNLYGMTLEQYIEGAEIHSRCFDQLKTISAASNN
ncbi:hypothetical protein [Flavobacterium sp. ACN6]|uniref:hypothetical protein n=1 Tax=Flavobacterium sp. ACN6 TaxID=1920426 RepID=UPI000BB34D66|nr:hypothetical protein [Flavobacterium sp. ACN6]PBJ08985.1 hypothetical protein BSF42_34670 [Flavobacterium sp. ACN6]